MARTSLFAVGAAAVGAVVGAAATARPGNDVSAFVQSVVHSHQAVRGPQPVDTKVNLPTYAQARLPFKAVLIRVAEMQSEGIGLTITGDENMPCATDDPESLYYCAMQPHDQEELVKLSFSGFDSSYQAWEDTFVEIAGKFPIPVPGLSWDSVEARCPVCRKDDSAPPCVVDVGSISQRFETPLCKELAGKTSLDIHKVFKLDNETAAKLPPTVKFQGTVALASSRGKLAEYKVNAKLDRTKQVWYDLRMKQGRQVFDGYSSTESDRSLQAAVVETDRKRKIEEEVRHQREKEEEKRAKQLKKDYADAVQAAKHELEDYFGKQGV